MYTTPFSNSLNYGLLNLGTFKDAIIILVTNLNNYKKNKPY